MDVKGIIKSVRIHKIDKIIWVIEICSIYGNFLFGFVLNIICYCLFKVGEEGLTKLTLHVCEEGLRLTEEASHRLNK